MSEDRFDNVTVIKKANVYFDGKVTSRNIIIADGTRKTLGFMLPGDYEFNTGSAEVMEVLNGAMKVFLPEASEWQTFETGQEFRVPGNSSFKLHLDGIADYCCSYG